MIPSGINRRARAINGAARTFAASLTNTMDINHVGPASGTNLWFDNSVRGTNFKFECTSSTNVNGGPRITEIDALLGVEQPPGSVFTMR